MSYGITGCEVQTNFDVCIQNAGGSLDPKGWAGCSALISDTAKYNKCVYDGYGAIITCFQGFCNNDPSGTINTIKTAYDQYKNYVEQAQPAAQTTQQQQASVTQQQQPVATGTTQQGTQQGTTQQGTTQQGTQQGATQGTTGNVNNGKINELNSGAGSNKVSKLLVSFLVVSGLLMNFL
ncbi:hypothetical protein BCR32DRAFT_264570 [Anaeromyces robustus]|uniref:Uncharacterized protein n=1 Tax=Anaeromyces robustus TaxID=1754192 RepID=A0A1Y1XMG9_9FUNG|nr:hypothetical protein BCR32DRAFT_264570 [Anaeromyces robustus]|eukprot:ORX86950.1 hypothetical protein BCR32DRAFT_264570 [Anaeromyces robustus]